MQLTLTTKAAPYIRHGFESIAACNVRPPEGIEDIKLMVLLKSPTATGSEKGDTSASEASSWEDLGEDHTRDIASAWDEPV